MTPASLSPPVVLSFICALRPGWEGGMHCRSEFDFAAVRGQGQQRRQISLEVEKINRTGRSAPLFRQHRAGGHRREAMDFFAGATFAGTGATFEEHVAGFKKPNASVLAVEVEPDRFEQTGPQTSAHCRHVVGDGIAQRDAAFAGQRGAEFAGRRNYK